VTPPVRIAVVGLDEPGTRLARAFADRPGAHVAWLCDRRREVRRQVSERFPEIRISGRFSDILTDETVDAVAIATAPSTHFELARRSLEADKHVFVTKPLALTDAHARALVELAGRRRRGLMVEHLLLFHPAIRKLKELIELGYLGDVYYVDAARQQLMRQGSDASTLWSLGAHEIAVILYLLGEAPVVVSARGESHSPSGEPDVVHCRLGFLNGVSGHLHLSRLDPRGTRRLAVVGSERTALVDRSTPSSLTVYERGAATSRRTSESRFGDVIGIQLSGEDSLELECEHFLTVTRSTRQVRDGRTEAARAVTVMSALARSLERGGEPEPLNREADGRDTPVIPLLRGKREWRKGA
jgi:predicted dehydrogenase